MEDGGSEFWIGSCELGKKKERGFGFAEDIPSGQVPGDKYLV